MYCKPSIERLEDAAVRRSAEGPKGSTSKTKLGESP